MAKENKDGQEKTETPSAKRKRKAREQGQVPRSMELNSAAVLIAGISTLTIFGGWMLNRIMNLIRDVYLHLDEYELNLSNIQEYFIIALKWLVTTVLPVFLVVAVFSIIINILQFGFLITTKPMEPKLSKLNPLTGFKKFFTQQNLVKLIVNLVKLFFIGMIAYQVLKREYSSFIPLMDVEVSGIFLYLTHTILKVAIWTLSTLLIIGLIDFTYQKWNNFQEMKMSKQEKKDEFKMSEGDPKVKARIRQTQFQLAFNTMIKELPQADVVITNPIHVAIALRYDPEQMTAPQVVGKGLRKLAERIKKVARENEIPVVENPPLARALYKHCEVGDEIPGQFYQDVAEILSRIYKLNEEVDTV